jgi:hypothetical protein
MADDVLLRKQASAVDFDPRLKALFSIIPILLFGSKLQSIVWAMLLSMADWCKRKPRLSPGCLTNATK